MVLLSMTSTTTIIPVVLMPIAIWTPQPPVPTHGRATEGPMPILPAGMPTRPMAGAGPSAEHWLMRDRRSAVIIIMCTLRDISTGPNVDFNQDGSPADLHSSNGNSDVFFTKLSLDNDYVFTKTWGGSGDDNARCICALADGRIILGGNFYGTVDFDPSSGVDSHSSNGFGDIFITCFDGSTQEHMWTRTFGGSGSDSVSDLVYDADSGYLFLTGFFNDSVDFDPAAREQNFTSNGSADIFVMRIDL